MPGGGIALLFPPGWDATIGAPYLAGPLLCGAVRARGFFASFHDLNNAVVSPITGEITAAEVAAAVAQPGCGAMNDLYFAAEDRLSVAARPLGGGWRLRDGYQPTGADWSKSSSVHEAAGEATPYDDLVLDRVDRIIRDERPRAVGITIAVPSQLISAFRLGRQIRERYPDLVILAGGNVVTHLGEAFYLPFVFMHFHGLVRFAGDLLLPDLLAAMAEGKDWRGVPGIVHWQDGGPVRSEGRLPAKADFRQPAYDCMEFPYWGQRYLTTVGSRGCYYSKCSFCSIPFGWGGDGHLGIDSPKAVAKHMLATSRATGIANWKFVDEALHPHFIDDLVTHLSAEGPRENLAFEGYVRLDAPWLNEARLERAASVGLRKLYVGFEMIEGASRNAMNKRDSADPAAFLAACGRAGILVHIFCMVGFPGTTRDDAINSVNFLLEREDLIDTLDLSGFEYSRNTVVQGIERLPSDSDWALSTGFAGPPGVLAAKEIDELAQELENAIWEYRPRWLHPVYRMHSPWAGSDGRLI